MRLSLITALFFLYSVSASPLLVPRPPTSPSLSPAEPPAQAPAVKPPPKAPVHPVEPPKPPKVPAKPPTEEHHPDNKPGKPHNNEPGKKPPVKKPPTKPHCKNNSKRGEDGPVNEAAHDLTERIGGGNTGDVFKTTFQGKEAVVKVIDASRPGGHKDAVKKEVTNLRTVHQFLGWGEEKPSKNYPEGRFFIVMPHMGVLGRETKLPDAELNKLVINANKHYLEKYGMENRDKNPNNYVFRQVGGKWQAEIIDWARAMYTGKTPQPAAGTPEVIENSSKQCNVM